MMVTRRFVQHLHSPLGLHQLFTTLSSATTTTISIPEQRWQESLSKLSTLTSGMGTPLSYHQHHHHCQALHRSTSFRPLTTTAATFLPQHQPNLLVRVIKKFGWYNKSRLRRSGCLLYESACENVFTRDFLQVCDLPDTFYSWFLVIELHVWMLMVRLSSEGKEGRLVRNSLLYALWEDCDVRSKKLGPIASSVRQEQLRSLGESFQVALVTYDEGLLGSDCVLASALWCRLFSKECSDPERLECLVNFVRQQMAALESMSRDEVLYKCEVPWVLLLEQDQDLLTTKHRLSVV